MLMPVEGFVGGGAEGRSGGGADLAEGIEEQVLLGPALGQMQGLVTGGAGASSGDGEEAPAQSTGSGAGWQLLRQADVHYPAGQVVGHGGKGQPGSVGRESP